MSDEVAATVRALRAFPVSAGGRLVRYGAGDTWGLFRIVDELVMGESVLVGVPTVLIAAGSLPDLEDSRGRIREGVTIQIGAVDYVTRFGRREGDGAMTRIALQEEV